MKCMRQYLISCSIWTLPKNSWNFTPFMVQPKTIGWVQTGKILQTTILPLLDAIIEHIPAPKIEDGLCRCRSLLWIIPHLLAGLLSEG
jgi:hypothetical protein